MSLTDLEVLIIMNIPEEIEDSEKAINLSTFFNEKNVLTIEKDLSAAELVEKIIEVNSPPSAFYIVNLGQVIKSYQKWKELFPYIEPFYAVKSNPNPVICELLSLLNVGFDVASKAEINLVKQFVDVKKKVVYANPVKESSSIQYARSIDVDLLVVDSVNELLKIKLYHPYTDILVRIKVDDTGSECRFSDKFGLEEKEFPKLFNFAKNLELKIIGVSFHVGSNCKNAEQYYNAIKLAKHAFEIAETYDYKLNVVNLGGGFTNKNEELLYKIKEQVDKAFEEFFPERDTLRIIAEPGRFFSEKSHILVVNVIGKKIKVVNGEKTICYTINDGVYQSFNCIIFDHQKPVLVPYNNNEIEKYKSTVYGPTCDSLDKICVDEMLPELEIGDICYVENMGAYSLCSVSTFNGFSIENQYYVVN